MKRIYITPLLNVVNINAHNLCSISGGRATIDTSDANAVGAGSSLSRRDNSFWDDEEE